MRIGSVSKRTSTPYAVPRTPYESPVRILIAAGGSGGHIFPAIALGRSLRESARPVELHYVGSDKALDRRLFEKEGVAYSVLSANKLPYRPSFRLAGFAFGLFIDLIRSLFIVIKFRPDSVAGFGGYVSFPVILAARALGVPTVVHEQNALPGRANKSLFKLSDKVAISFEETRSAMGPEGRKAVFTGNPIRTSIFTDDKPMGRKRFGLDPDKFTILLIGGSQGASFLNRAFVDALGLMDGGARRSLQVIHITGVKDYEWAVGRYASSGVDHRVHSFIDRIEEAYAASDLAVTRSGSSAIFELALLGRAMILVPYPFAASHQSANAGAFSRSGAAIVIDERELSAGRFRDTVEGLMKDRQRLKALGEAARRMSVPDASAKLAGEVLGLARKQPRS